MTRSLGALAASVLLVVGVGCADGGGAPTPATSPSPSVTAAAAPAPPAPPEPTPTPTASPTEAASAYGPLVVDLAGDGPHRGTLEGPDGTRTFTVHLPDGSVSGAPLLVGLHGFTQGSAGFETYTALAADATARGVVTVTPDGIEDSWNGGLSCCPPAARDGVDDVGFLRVLAGGLTRELSLDAERTWAAGFSNGGFLALRLACEAPNVFDAVVSHAGTMDLPCAPEEPVSVLLSHGDRDTLVPFEGGRGPVSPQSAGRGARDVFDAWRQLDRCPEPVPRTSLAGEDLLAAPCEDGAGVGLVVWDGVGHTWPDELNGLLLDWLEADAERRGTGT